MLFARKQYTLCQNKSSEHEFQTLPAVEMSYHELSVTINIDIPSWLETLSCGHNETLACLYYDSSMHFHASIRKQ